MGLDYEANYRFRTVEQTSTAQFGKSDNVKNILSLVCFCFYNLILNNDSELKTCTAVLCLACDAYLYLRSHLFLVCMSYADRMSLSTVVSKFDNF